jgi:hypothetical protein
MDLKTKAVAVVLQRDEDLYANTHNPSHVWHAWQVARRMKASIPDWVLQFLDRIAEREIVTHSRNTDTAERYEAALTQMDAAVDRHRNRLAMRKVAKQLGVHLEVSRRDSPNLTAIARDAAKANRVSVNRLLDRYRSSR